MIYFISDLHLNHDRSFIYKPRGFNNIEDMNKAIIDNWKAVIKPEDDVYVLGDLMLNDNEKGIEMLKSLPGTIHIIRGNHDTDTRLKLYKELPNVIYEGEALTIKYDKYSIKLSHEVTLVATIGEYHFSQQRFCFFGHTHSKDKFYNDNPWLYNVACDAHDCKPVSIDEALADCRAKYDECAKML